MGKVIPKSVLEDIRFRSDIAEVIGSYFTLQRAGANFKALCPFHKEKTPSFHVNAQRQIFHCFGCGAGGDVFRFIMDHESVDFVTAVSMLANRAGVPIDLEEGDGETSNKAQLYKIHAELARLYHRKLMESHEAQPARDYLKQRSLTDETLAAFQVGYAPNRWDAMLSWGRQEHYTPALLEEGGLIIHHADRAGTDREYYDRFRDRVMFPITDEQNRVIGFSGRLMNNQEKAAKYVNSPETPLFHKSRVLYALGTARRAIVESRDVVLCEGQIDVIRCHQVGIITAVAAQGTAFSEDHARILKRYADSVVIAFDTDKAGEDAAIRAATVFMSAGLAVRVARLPPEQDPDSFIEAEGVGAFRSVLERAGSAVGFQIDVLSRRENIQSEVGVMRVAKAVLATITHSPSAVQRARLVQEAAGRLQLPATALQDDLRSTILQASSRYRRSDAPHPAETVQDAEQQPPKEVALCEHLVHIADAPEMGTLLRQYLPLTMLTGTLCRAVITAALDCEVTGRDIQDALRTGDASTGALQRFAAQVEMAPIKVIGQDLSRVDAVKDLVLHLWQRRLKRERDALYKKDDSDSSARRQQLTLDLIALKSWETGTAIIGIALAGDGTPQDLVHG